MKIKKKSGNFKPASEAQQRARERNWNKGQVLCIRTIAHNIHNSKTTNAVEKTLLAMTVDSLNAILDNWNK